MPPAFTACPLIVPVVEIGIALAFAAVNATTVNKPSFVKIFITTLVPPFGVLLSRNS